MIRQVSVEKIAQAAELLAKLTVKGSDAPILARVFALLSEVVELNIDSPAPKSEELIPL